MHARYLRTLLLFCTLTWLPAFLLNLVLVRNEGNIEEISFAASAWQEKTRGITYSTTIPGNALFKTLRLNDRLPEIDTIVLSSSTLMPVDSTMFPETWRIYNFSQRASPLNASIGQAEYLLAKAPQIKRFVIAVDWPLGFPYQDPIGAPLDLSRPQQKTAQGEKKHSFLANAHEALTYARMEGLWQVLRNISKSGKPVKSFREHFFQFASDPYICPDGVAPGIDFGIHDRGVCNGFRFDGGATYAGYKMASSEKELINKAFSANWMYVESLKKSQGIVNPALLKRLSMVSDTIKKQGGTLILVFPPLSPGLEKAFLQHPQYSAYLQRTKRDFADWNKVNQITLLDFAQSEKFGCTVNEFLDQHHATPSCFRKSFGNFWKSSEGAAIIARSQRR